MRPPSLFPGKAPVETYYVIIKIRTRAEIAP
jgi:hypothetical protein